MELPEVWSVIAEAEPVRGSMRWSEIPDSGISVSEARRMHRDGAILMAQRRLPSGRMGLVIKVVKQSA